MSARQAVLGKQSSALRARVNDDLKTATSRYTKLQSTAAYASKTAQAAIMKTVTSSQATTHEAAVEAANAKLKKTAASKTKKSSKAKSATGTAAAKKAGLAAASKVKSTTVKQSVHQGSSSVRTVKSSSAKAASSVKKSAVSKVSPVARGAAKGTSTTCTPVFATRDEDSWFGSEHEANCVSAAVANHLAFTEGIFATSDQVAELTDLLGYAPTIVHGLEVAREMARRGAWPAVPRFAPNVLTSPIPGMLIGYEALTDEGYKPHAALLVDAFTVISWGDAYSLESSIDESWVVMWRLPRHARHRIRLHAVEGC
jgi:hypothetical protein